MSFLEKATKPIQLMQNQKLHLAAARLNVLMKIQVTEF
jgi:hypothetical protein